MTRDAVTPDLRPRWQDRFRVEIPEAECDGLRVERFEVVAHSLENLKLSMEPGRRDCSPGWYTRLCTDRVLWMSDTDAEMSDHLTPFLEARQRQARRVLVNGLGLGMIVKGLLTLDSVKHIDVVEADQRVITLVGPSYDDPRVTVHHADAYEQATRWPAKSHWDVAWHDIWPTLCEDNLPEMARLHRSYGRRVSWQGSWGKELLLAERRRTAGACWRS